MQTDFLPEHLPVWMRQPRRSFDWGILLAAAIGLLSAWAFLVRPGLPAFSDLLHSGFMVSDLADGLREGQLFARWSPHVLGGYGAPVPVFLPHGAPFIAALVDQLFTGDVTSAIRFLLVSAAMGGGVGQYLFCRRWVSPAAALLSSALYTFSPIMGLTASHVAGDLAGIVAMGILPFSLWSTTRLAEAASVWDIPVTALIFTALLYIHPAAAAGGFMVALLITLPQGRTALLRLTGAIGTAVGLFAPFWLPAITYIETVEWRSTIQLERTVVSLIQLIQPLKPIDPAALNPAPQYTLGTALPIFMLAALAWMLLTRHHRRFLFTMAVAGFASALWAVVYGAHWPTYLLTLTGAAIGGVALEWRSTLPLFLRRASLPAALVILLMSSQAVWLSPFGPSAHDFSPKAQVEYEQSGFGIAILPDNAALPATTRAGLAPERSLIESYGSPLLTRIPAGSPARVTPIYSGIYSSAWQVSTTTPATLTITLAYFPNWSATLNGQSLPVQRNPSGLLNVALPQTTNGTLRITFDALPEDGVAWILALASAIGLFAWVRMGKTGDSQSIPFLNVQEVRLTSFALVAISLGLLSVAMPDGAFRLRPEAFSSLQDAMPLTATAAPLRLLGYKFEITRIQAGEALPVTLYWTALDEMDTNYGIRLILIDIDRQIRYPLTAINAPGDLSTGRWLPDRVVQDSYILPVPYDLTAGTYQLSAEAYPCNAGCDLRRPQQFFDGQGIGRPSITFPTILTVGK